MAEYKLTDGPYVIRAVDHATVPNDPANSDWVIYQKWLTDGGVPDPYVPSASVQSKPAPETTVLYDHENRLRGLEGQPPLTMDDFLNKMQKK